MSIYHFGFCRRAALFCSQQLCVIDEYSPNVRLLEPLFHADKVLTCYFVKSLQGHKMVSTSTTYSTCHCHVMMGSDVIRSTAVTCPSTYTAMCSSTPCLNKKQAKLFLS